MMRRPRTLGGKSKAQARRDRDALRSAAKPWRQWYGLAVWRSIRQRQLSLQPLCERCLRRGLAVAATVVNHVVPHKGDWERFISGPFESCCKPCHDSEVQAEEKAAARAAAAERTGGWSKV